MNKRMNSLVAGQYPRTGGRCSWALCVFPGAMSHGDGMADPSVLAVFQDYVKLMPLVAEANQMGEELEKVGARRQYGTRSRKGLGEQGPRTLTPLPPASFVVWMGTGGPGEVGTQGPHWEP